MARVAVSYAKVEEQPVGADRLFKVMMRLEFALKEIGFCRSANKQNAEVDWDRFANERLGASFFDALKASDCQRHREPELGADGCSLERPRFDGRSETCQEQSLSRWEER